MYVLHPWHGAHYGDKAPQTVNGLIEIPQGSRTKYEIDKTTGLLRLDRIIYSSFHYPINYGFIPQTLDEDGDELDSLVVCAEPIPTGVWLEAKVIGVLNFVDDGEADHKIVLVPVDDRNTGNNINTLADLGERWQQQIVEHFTH